MALIVHCNGCGDELMEPGGIYLTPPDPDDGVVKNHLCVICDRAVRDFIGSLSE